MFSVSVRALQVMLDNMEKKDPPIIVACHTNHAVDQLLREVHKIAPLCFVRLGGRSQDKQIIKPQTIYELKQREDNPVPRSGITSTALRTIDTLGRELGKMLKPLLSDEKFDLAVLEADGILSNEQKTSLEKEAARWVNAGNASEVTDALKIWAAKSTAPPEARDNMLPMFTYEEVELEREDLEEKEAEAAPADEEARAEYLQGNYLELGESFVCTKPNARVRADRKGKVPKEFRSVSRLVDQTQDLNMVQLDTRGLVYEYLIKRLKESRRDEVRRLAVRYAEAVKQRTIGTWTENAWLLKQHRIVGMTTTGLSKYRGLIAAIKPKVVMIEEAGEVLEAPVIAGALESVQHLILVGDHQQLKPHLHVHELEGAPYHLDRSLLERLVDAGVEYDQLQTQRRMVPEVSRLLGPIYGEGTIKNHEGMSDPDVRPYVVLKQTRALLDANNSQSCSRHEEPLVVRSFIPRVALRSNWLTMFRFFDHQWLESRDGQMSSLNKEEAAMIVGFVTHLYHNGTPLQHITSEGTSRSLLEYSLRS